MSIAFLILTIVFIIISTVMILIILVQRPQGGGLAGAFGGASGGSTDTVFGGRVGDALTMMTVAAFLVYVALALFLNIIPIKPTAAVIAPPSPTITSTNPDGTTNTLQLTPSSAPPAGTLPNQPGGTTSTPPATNPPATSPSDTSATEPPATTPATTPSSGTP